MKLRSIEYSIDLKRFKVLYSFCVKGRGWGHRSQLHGGSILLGGDGTVGVEPKGVTYKWYVSGGVVVVIQDRTPPQPLKRR